LYNRFQFSFEARWSEKCTGILTEQMEVVRIFENLLENVKEITDKKVPYIKY